MEKFSSAAPVPNPPVDSWGYHLANNFTSFLTSPPVSSIYPLGHRGRGRTATATATATYVVLLLLLLLRLRTVVSTTSK